MAWCFILFHVFFILPFIVPIFSLFFARSVCIFRNVVSFIKEDFLFVPCGKCSRTSSDDHRSDN
jgi:hypothetical protein